MYVTGLPQWASTLWVTVRLPDGLQHVWLHHDLNRLYPTSNLLQLKLRMPAHAIALIYDIDLLLTFCVCMTSSICVTLQPILAQKFVIHLVDDVIWRRTAHCTCCAVVCWQSIVASRELSYSLAVREFLAYDCDPAIAFVRKPSDVQRFDHVSASPPKSSASIT